MIARRCTLAALLAALFWTCVAPAAAQRPVTGGGSFSDAPALEAGTFTDNVLPRETVFYAVRLRQAQRLRVRVSVDLTGASRLQGDTPHTGRLIIDLYTPLRQRLAREIGSDSADLNRLVSTITGPRVVPAAAAERRAAGANDYTGPGPYYLTIVLSESILDSGATVELPLRLDVETGPATGATAGRGDPGPLGAAAADRTVAAATSDQGDEPGGQSLVVLLAAGAGGLAAGALLGYFGVRARRPRPAPGAT